MWHGCQPERPILLVSSDAWLSQACQPAGPTPISAVSVCILLAKITLGLAVRHGAAVGPAPLAPVLQAIEFGLDGFRRTMLRDPGQLDRWSSSDSVCKSLYAWVSAARWPDVSARLKRGMPQVLTSSNKRSPPPKRRQMRPACDHILFLIAAKKKKGTSAFMQSAAALAAPYILLVELRFSRDYTQIDSSLPPTRRVVRRPQEPLARPERVSLPSPFQGPSTKNKKTSRRQSSIIEGANGNRQPTTLKVVAGIAPQVLIQK